MLSYSEWLQMGTYSEWLIKVQEMGGAGGVYDPKIKIDGSWMGAPRGVSEPLSSVGDVKIKKPRKKKK